jgi:hypothetical protein
MALMPTRRRGGRTRRRQPRRIHAESGPCACTAGSSVCPARSVRYFDRSNVGTGRIPAADGRPSPAVPRRSSLTTDLTVSLPVGDLLPRSGDAHRRHRCLSHERSYQQVVSRCKLTLDDATDNPAARAENCVPMSGRGTFVSVPERSEPVACALTQHGRDADASHAGRTPPASEHPPTCACHEHDGRGLVATTPASSDGPLLAGHPFLGLPGPLRRLPSQRPRRLASARTWLTRLTTRPGVTVSPSRRLSAGSRSGWPFGCDRTGITCVAAPPPRRPRVRLRPNSM